MIDREKYITGQKASGIEVGDTVRVVREAEYSEGGWNNSWAFKMKLGEQTVEDEDCGSGFRLSDKYSYPYFVLEIVKKKDGSVPREVLDNTNSVCLERNSNMSTQEQTVFDVTIVERTEVLHEGSGVVQKINRAVLHDAKVAAVSNEAAKQKALAKCKVTNFDNVEITCCPFRE